MKNIHLIMINEPESLPMRLAQMSKTIGNVIFKAQKQCQRFKDCRPAKFVHSGNISLANLDMTQENTWVIISNGRYITKINQELIKKLTAENGRDLIMLNVDKTLEPYRENIRTKSDNEVTGYRRFFFDSIMPDCFPDNWPHHILIRLSALKMIINERSIPTRFSIFLKRSIFNGLKMQTFKISGQIIDLHTEDGILSMMNESLSESPLYPYRNSISPQARLYGRVILGENAQIDNGAIIIGPAIIGENVTIPSSATVYRSIICPGMTLPENSFVRMRIADLPQLNDLYSNEDNSNNTNQTCLTTCRRINNYRTWPFFSYARLGKRLCDIIIALFVLPLFSIIFVIIAVAVKLTSPGPIFFKHKRQGLNGKTFSCLKFRTMIINADDIQEKLGCKNQVDGPQFKIEDDPRVTIIGRFLRDTHIDEIPQFINILLGQMSLIGPRPSPAKENSFCSHWRDARLSVRPGITGLWQICRTRQEGQDFQEWIYYDTKYVKNISMTQDIKIFFKTAAKLLLNLIRYF